MISLVVLQILWQKQAYEIERKDHAIRVLYALNKVRAKLKNANSCVTFFSKPGFMPNEGMYILKQKWNKTGYFGEADTIPVFLAKDEIKKKNEIGYKYDGYKSGFATYAEITINIIYSPSDIMDTSTINAGNYNEVIRNKNNINDFFDTATISTFIKEKLKEENIETSFGYGFIDIESNKINLLHGTNDSSAAKKSIYGIDVFRNDRFISPQRLVLVFDDVSRGFRFSPAMLSILVILLICVLLFILYQFFQKQKKLSDLKTEFIQNLNHEMNTPITNIQLAIEWMKQYTDAHKPEVQKLHEIIVSESVRLQQHIDRSLQIGMLENKTLLMNKTIEDLDQLLQSVCNLFISSVEKEGGTMQYHADGKYLAEVDKMHFTNCISSILENAIKYKSKERKLSVTCSLSVENQFVKIKIEDNGRGMGKEARHNVFEKFYREDSGLVHNTKGFGIGLSYVKAVIEMHNGEVSATSEPDKWSIFEIKLPLYTQ